MIEAEHSVLIGSAIENVWGYVSDIRRWADLMPGCKECTVIDNHDSRWLLKVGVAALVRTVNVLVHVDEWNGPEEVKFTYQLAGDPVKGGGAYVASQKSEHETEVSLRVQVEGSGPMAPMWEALCKPLLPQLVKTFAGRLKMEIEKTTGASDSSLVSSPEKKLSRL